MAEEYRVKIGKIFWMHLLLLLIIASFIVLIVWDAMAVVLVTVIIGPFVVYFAMVAIRTRYVLDRDCLTVKGVIGETAIPYDSVRRIIGNSKSLINYGIVVTSLDRIEISYGKSGHILISPVEKEEFLDALRARCRKANYMETEK